MTVLTVMLYSNSFLQQATAITVSTGYRKGNRKDKSSELEMI